ncbi:MULTISPECIES: TraR/DksA C4-type zinc finger protein [Halomonas]|uniref:TraR/DksA C4-type zinc finger protein n=1 Tax=Halomonas TaxID=2745 RepID=UPI001C954BC3|nr:MULTISPECIES: TraR/DksA C4-type zinc finger protein [Halomonas]MBY6206917.1 TraR/DksA C4-type zinc finger protein [Halomonas sp. DP3Y7-2]MBY6230391.1 TraR/DksA C4-type zinc finger protein [Halomonas sp. DP3Y7-1]MCA0918551.1 TraR/DksA C4-type zinc finger protein [Halomonas denitrificans]
MADRADIAAELIEMSLEGSLASRLQLTTTPAAKTTECEDCGDEIPAARRRAAPWATTCIECQEIHERKRRHVR